MNYLIVGLGNIGFEYTDTRHNIGFTVLDAWAGASNIVFKSCRYGYIAEDKHRGRNLTLLKPSTYMNLSGRAVHYWMIRNRVPLSNLLVLVDDIALPLGVLRMREKGSDGGHNGLLNIIETLGTNAFTRLRIGIGDNFFKGMQVDYVLGSWSEEEKKMLPDICHRAVEASKSFCSTGAARTMNEFNKK